MSITQPMVPTTLLTSKVRVRLINQLDNGSPRPQCLQTGCTHHWILLSLPPSPQHRPKSMTPGSPGWRRCLGSFRVQTFSQHEALEPPALGPMPSRLPLQKTISKAATQPQRLNQGCSFYLRRRWRKKPMGERMPARRDPHPRIRGRMMSLSYLL